MLGRQRPFSPSVPAEAGCLLTVAAGVHVFISGESLHCFLVGWRTNKSYVIATSDLWLFIHASNLLSLYSPSPLPYKSWRLRAGLEVEESWPTRRQCSGAVWRHRQTVERSCRGALGSVAELSGTEAVRGDLTTELHLHLWLTCNSYSNRIQSFARCLQPRQPSPPTWTNAPCGLSAAVPSTVPGEWDPPSWAGWPTSWYPWATDSSQLTSAWCPRRGQGLHQHLREVHCGAML